MSPILSARRFAPAALLACALPLALACGDDDDPIEPTPLTLAVEVVASGIDAPTHVTAPEGDPRLFIVEQPGRIRIVEDGELLERPFLDITDRVSSGGEQGLFSMAFHPDFEDNGYFYVDYTDLEGDTRVVRYTVSATDPDSADPASAHQILHVPQPTPQHNGGQIAFGPDGMLYIAMGDGGNPETAQDLSSLLGKMLRLNVDGGDPYAIPADNPFVDEAGARDEIWASGLRNPWRFSFDEPTGQLIIADVGERAWEEVNAVPASAAGLDYGWNTMEGPDCYQPSTGCDPTGITLPVFVYDRDDGCAITGGHVYRGSAIPDLAGHYFYSDSCTGWLRSFRIEDGEPVDHREWEVGDIGAVVSFGTGGDGELYIASFSPNTVYRIVQGE